MLRRRPRGRAGLRHGPLQPRDGAPRAGAARGSGPRRRPRPALRPAGGPIRLGYLSGDFHDHATTHLVAEAIERHDRAGFAVHGYSYGPDDGSPARARVVRAFDRFVDLAGWGDEAAADRIRADGIDVLVDLKGYTAHARPQIVALRPAAVQVSWLGFPGTMGADFIDAVLADAATAPPSLQRLCTERILRLPDTFQPIDTTRVVGAPLPRPAYGLPERGFVFCCFNNGYKIGPGMFAIWMRLLRGVEGAVLWLLAGNPEARANLAREAAAAGVDPARLVLAPRLPMAEHLARHGAADLFLDTQPVNAMTTASDALWAGLPVLTCLGATVAGRGGASLVRAAGLPELVAPDLAGYEALALGLARAPERLAALRDRLADRRAAPPLFDTPRFVAGLEAAFRGLVDLARLRPAGDGGARDDFDHLGREWAADAPAVWADLRRRRPVARTDRHGGLALPTRYDDIRAISYDTGRFSSRQLAPLVQATGVAPEADLDHRPVTTDPPDHHWQRMTLVGAFSPERVAALEPEATALARRLLAALPDRGEVDAAADYAFPLALRALCRRLGVRDADVPRLGELAAVAVSSAAVAEAGLAAAMEGLLGFFGAEIRHRIDHPGEDVVSHLLSMRHEGRPLPTDHVKATLRTLVVAGVETVAGTIGHALNHLAGDPDLARRLREGPELLPEAVEEFLRLSSPVILGRTVVEPTEVGGCPLAAGSLLLLPFGAANRDPAAFPDPDALVFGRPASPPHLAFGIGIHRCVGAPLARMLTAVALHEWLAACPSFAPGAVGASWAIGLLRGPKRLPLAVERLRPTPAKGAPWRPEPPRRDAGALHGCFHLDLGGARADAFVRVHNPREARRTLLCLHGFIDNGSDFARLADVAGAAGYRVLCPDWPGRGRSDHLPPRLYTMGTYFAVVRACLASAAGELDVVASSFGSLVALDFLSGTGTPFRRAVLVDPILRGGPAYDRLAEAMIGGAWKTFDDVDSLAEGQARVLESLRLLDRDALRGHVLARATRVGGRYRIAADPALAEGLRAGIARNFDMVGHLAKLVGRVMIAYGEASPFKGADLLAAVASLRPDAVAAVDFPGGHAPLLKTAGEVDRIMAFLRA